MQHSFDSPSRILRFFFLLVLGCGFSVQSVSAQTEEMRVLDGVSALQEQLESASFEERDQAEVELIKLGTEALDYIADPSDEFTDDLNKRLIRVRKKLEEVAVKEAISPSQISLVGSMTLKSAFDRIKKQTENVIALGEGYDEAILKKEVSLDLKEVSFWTALADITTRGGLNTIAYSGVDGQTTVVPKPPVDPTLVDKAVTVAPVPLDEAGIFKVRVTNVNTYANLAQPHLSFTTLLLEIQWEPRLTPISIDLPLSSVTILDENGDKVEVSNPAEVLSGRVQTGTNQIELPLKIKSVDRSIGSIKSIKAKLECVLPGRREKFRFGELGGIEGEPKISRAGVTVQYLGIEQNEDLHVVNLRVGMESEGALESHLGWIYDNPLYLVGEGGKKNPSIGHQGGDMDEDGVMIQYFFVDDPSKFELLYESPGAIVSVPAEITIENISLP